MNDAYCTLRELQPDGTFIPRSAPIISEESLASCRAIITDEWLDWMADRYRRLGIHYWTGVEFHKYLLCAEPLEAEADRKRRYLAMRLTVRGCDMGIMATTN